MKNDLAQFKQFKRAIQKDEIVFLFGTGISSALTGCPYSWWKWIVDGIHGLENNVLSKTLSAELESDTSTENMVRVAGKVITAAKRDGTYNAWMQNEFEQGAVANAELATTLRKLLRTQTVFATTNYDLLLEHATGLKTLTYNDTNQAFAMLDKRLSTHVLHLHGIYDSKAGIDNIIADETQYETIMADQGAQFIQGILGTRTLIFVGCGKTTEDVNIARFILFAKKHLKMDRQYFFLYNTNSPVVELPANITPIPYGSDYEDLPLFMEDLAQVRLTEIVKNNHLIGRTAFQKEIAGADGLSRFHYAQKSIPFCGRVEQLKQLLSFVDAEQSFLWWAVTGQAGSGKSRLALELISRLPVSWFGFFINDRLAQQHIDNFRPFCNTVVVIDYVAGRERLVSGLLADLKKIFAVTVYKLRILLLERDNTRISGSWYSTLLQRLGRFETEDIKAAEYAQQFLDLPDLLTTDVEAFIAAVCASKGLSPDAERDSILRKAYGRKYEKLQYRPLFVQLFVEAWIENNYCIPHYDSFTGILEVVIQREQKKWLDAVNGSQSICNSFIHLLVRANITGFLETEHLPEFYQKDWESVKSFIANSTFPGKQQKESQQSLINYFCQNIETGNTLVAPLFPDIIKEFMFCYYTEQERLPGMMKEIWQNATIDFSRFLIRCMSDFPEQGFFLHALNAYKKATEDIEVLKGRLFLLEDRLIQPGEDPQAFFRLIDNEHKFWASITVPEGDNKNKEVLASFKVAGLNKVASHLGAWSLFDITDMIMVIDEMLEVKGGPVTEIIKKTFLSEQITKLATSSFSKAALYLQEKLDSMVKEGPKDSLNASLNMISYNQKLMNALLQNQFASATEILQIMSKECCYDDLLAVQILAHSCLNLEHFSFLSGNNETIGYGNHIALQLVELYPEDWQIRSRCIGCQVSVLQYNYFAKKITEHDFLKELASLETAVSTMSFTGDVADEALGITWSAIKTLKINVADECQVREIISDAEEVLKEYPAIAEVVRTKILAVGKLHKDYLHTKVTHSEVEELFKYVEINYDSAVVREAFFQMLEESEDAGRKRDYFTEKVVHGARQDAKYNPLYSSGVPEFDAEAGKLKCLINPSEPYIRPYRKVGANELCPCGSGKKFKRCCKGKGIFD